MGVEMQNHGLPDLRRSAIIFSAPDDAKCFPRKSTRWPRHRQCGYIDFSDRNRDTFSRALAKLDTIPFEVSIPALTYSQARDVLIGQAIAVVSHMRVKNLETVPLNRILLADCPISPG